MTDPIDINHDDLMHLAAAVSGLTDAFKALHGQVQRIEGGINGVLPKIEERLAALEERDG